MSPLKKSVEKQGSDFKNATSTSQGCLNEGEGGRGGHGGKTLLDTGAGGSLGILRLLRTGNNP